MSNKMQIAFQQWLIANAATDPYDTIDDWSGDYDSDAELFND